MATRYWVGGSGTWDTTTTTNWSTASNGAGGASAPTSADNVIIDTSSGTGTITCTAGVCNNLTVTATQAIILGAASSTLSVYGSLTFPSGGSFSASTNSWTLTFAGTTTGLTITTNGKSLSTIIFNGVGGGWTLGSALTTTVTITLTNGTFDTSSSGNYPVSIGTQISLGVGTKTLNLNASTVTFTGGNFYLYFDTNSTGFTFNAGTSQINFTGLNCNFFGGGFTFYNVSFTSNGGINIQMTGTNTFNNLLFTNRTGANYSTFNLGNNITVNGTLTLSTTSTGVSRLFVYTPTVGTQSTITLNGTLASMSDVDFRDIVAAGTAGTWSGTRIGNCLNNSNITFSTPKTVYWNLAGSQSWLGTTSGWATTSTGIPALTNFPLPQDTATFTEAGAAGTINNAASIQIGNIQMADGISNRVSPFTLNMDTGGAVIYGSVTFFSGLTMTGTNTVTFSGQGITQNITNAGVTWTAPITVNNPTGTYKLLDNETLGSTLTFTLTAGTVNLNNNTLTTGIFLSSNTNTRSILWGTGNITVTGNNTTVFTAYNNGYSQTGTPVVNLTYSGSTGTRSILSTSVSPYSIAFNISAGSDTISLGTSSYFGDLDFTGFTGTIVANTPTTNTMLFNGNLKLNSSVTLSSIGASVTFGGTGVTQQITTAGKTIPAVSGVTFNGVGTTFQLQDSFTVGSSVTTTLTNGTLDLNNKTLTTGIFSSNNSNTRSLTFGTGNITTNGSGTVWNTSTGTGLSYTGSGTVNISNNSATATTVTAGSNGGGSSSNAFNFNFTTGTYALTLSTSNTVGNLNFTGFTGTWAPGTATSSFYGSLTLVSGMTFTTGTGTWVMAATSGTQVITSAGKTLYTITQSGAGGTVQLADALTSTGIYTLTAGTLDLNSKTLTTGLFSSSNSNIRSLLMGSGTLTLSGTGTVWNAATSTNFILIPGTGKISLTSASAKTFAGGGASYPTLSQDGLGTLTITGSNRFYKITNSVQPTTITFTAGTNTTVDVWAVSGTAGSLVTVNSSAASNFGLIKVPSGEPVVSNYLAIQYSTATPSSGTWYAGPGSTNSGFNSGWIFTGIPYQNLAGRLYNTGNLLLANTSIFNEYVQNNISIQAYEMFAGQLDEFTGAGIVDPSLVLWLDAGQTASYPGTGTTWYDLSGRNNNGTLVNAPTYTANTAVGGTFNFNGTTQYVSLPTFNLAYGSSWTINAWVNWTGATPFTSGGAYPMIFSDNGNDGILLFGINTTNRPGVDVGFNIYSSGETFNNQTVTANSWYNVVATSGQGFLTIYVNGQLVISGTTTGFIGFANGAWIGNGANFGNSNWQGYISAVSVYNRVLAINEIVANYNALAKRYSATPIANNIIPARMVGPGTMLINGQFDEYTGIS